MFKNERLWTVSLYLAAIPLSTVVAFSAKSGRPTEAAGTVSFHKAVGDQISTIENPHPSGVVRKKNKRLQLTTSVPSARHQRYAAFQDFQKTASKRFRELLDRSPEALRLDGIYSFCVTPGGRHGGRNARLFEVFFGNRSYDEHEALDGSSQRRSMRLLAEHGATLQFMRDDLGRVHVFLYPAASEGMKPLEDFIELGVVDSAARLKKDAILARYFRRLMAYMQCTCLDGLPSPMDRLTVAMLRLFRRRSVDGRMHATRFSTAVRETIKWALTVGLSGALLAVVQTASSSGKPATVVLSAEPPNTLQQRATLVESEKENGRRLEAIERLLGDIRARLNAPLLTAPVSQPPLRPSKGEAADGARQKTGK